MKLEMKVDDGDIVHYHDSRHPLTRCKYAHRNGATDLLSEEHSQVRQTVSSQLGLRWRTWSKDDLPQPDPAAM